MRNSISLLKKLRVALALSIAVANILVFAAATPDAKQACYKCVLVAGGGTGYYADCQIGGTTLDLCLYTTLTHCYGYQCGRPFGDEEEGFEAESGEGLQH